MTRVSRRKHSHGFTLLEVMIALAILAVGLAAVVRTTSSAVGNAVYLRESTLAHWVAMNKIAEVQLQKDWPPVGVTKGTADFASHEWLWESSIIETEEPKVHRIDVSVYANKGEKEPLAKLVAYVEQPLQ